LRVVDHDNNEGVAARHRAVAVVVRLSKVQYGHEKTSVTDVIGAYDALVAAAIAVHLQKEASTIACEGSSAMLSQLWGSPGQSARKESGGNAIYGSRCSLPFWVLTCEPHELDFLGQSLGTRPPP
jgi:hypothetical protein